MLQEFVSFSYFLNQSIYLYFFWELWNTEVTVDTWFPFVRWPDRISINNVQQMPNAGQMTNVSGDLISSTDKG